MPKSTKDIIENFRKKVKQKAVLNISIPEQGQLVFRDSLDGEATNVQVPDIVVAANTGCHQYRMHNPTLFSICPCGEKNRKSCVVFS